MVAVNLAYTRNIRSFCGNTDKEKQISAGLHIFIRALTKGKSGYSYQLKSNLPLFSILNEYLRFY
jgi:hypothetical protein